MIPSKSLLRRKYGVGLATICLCCFVGDSHTLVAERGAKPEPRPRSHAILLPIRSFQQTKGYTCGPAVLVTLLRHHRRDGNELQIAKDAKCTPAKGTSPKGMVEWLKKNGFDVEWGENGSLDMLRNRLKKGQPTIIEWIDWGGHWVMVVGYDTRGTRTLRDDVITFADPADHYDGKRDGLTSFNALRFQHMWFDAFLFDRPMRRVYIMATPKK